jgi:hypothetical protein
LASSSSTCNLSLFPSSLAFDLKTLRCGGTSPTEADPEG